MNTMNKSEKIQEIINALEITQPEYRAWDRFSSHMKYFESPNDWGGKIPSNADKCLVFMQFIKSNDKDGKKVFEGDILQAPSGNLFIVKWFADELRWRMYDGSGWYNLNMGLMKVIGNVFENEDLYKKIFENSIV